jgi:hypothetical protein
MLGSFGLKSAKVLVEAFEEAHLKEFIKLSHVEYGKSPTADIDHIAWKHLRAPLGPSTYIRLVANGGNTVGRVMLQPRQVNTASGQFPVSLITDGLIDTEFRSTPTNFINLINTAGNVPAFSFVCHTSNEVTEPLYRKLFRFPQPFSLSGYGFPVRLAGFFLKFSRLRLSILDWLILPLRWLVGLLAFIMFWASKLNLSERLPDDDRLALLCSKSLNESGPFFVRNQSFLKWRFKDAPEWSSEVYCIEREGEFFGYLVMRRFELDGLNYLAVADFLIDPALTIFERLAIRSWLILEALKSGVDALFTMINPKNIIARKGIGFPLMCIPDKFLPHGTPIFMWTRKGKSCDFDKVESTYMTLADLDYL